MAESRVAKAKREQEHTKEFPCCANCDKFSYREDGSRRYSVKKDKRCIVGGFATSDRCWCKLHGRQKGSQ